MSMPPRPAAPIQTLSSPVQQAVYTHFASRPSIEDLIRTTLLAALNERYPTLTVELASTRLASPHESGVWGLPPKNGWFKAYRRCAIKRKTGC